MSKVTKKIAKLLLHSLAGVVLVAILLILGVAMALSLPRVQTFVAHSATEWLNRKCGTNITIGAISLENISRLTAEELYVEDLRGDTLLWASKLQGKIDRTALLEEGRFVPYDIRIKGAKLYLSDGTKGSNIDSLVKHIASHFPADTTTTGATFKIENVRAEDFRFKLYDDRFAGRVPKTSIDYSDMDLHIASATFGHITIEGADVVIGNVTDINATDKSGAALRDSRMGMLRVGVGGLLAFKDIDFRTGGSHLVLPSLVLSGKDWKDYSDFCDKVRLTLHTEDSVLEPQSAGKWVHELDYFGLQGENITGSFDGVVNDFVVDIEGKLYNSDIDVKGGVQHIVTPAEVTADIDLSISTSPDKVRNIYHSILHQPLPEEIGVWIDKFDTLVVVARAQAKPEAVTTTATLSTNLGDVDIDGTLHYGESGAFDGTIRSNGLDLGKVLGSASLGEAYLTLDGEVAFGQDRLSGDVTATVERLGFADYDFEDINLHANLAGDRLNARLVSNDPNALLSAEAVSSVVEGEPEYNLNLNLERVNFGTIGLGDKERGAWIAVNMDANLRGASFDSMVGRAMINDLTFATAADTLSTELVNISLSGGEGDKSFSIYSPILDLEYRSTAPYAAIINYLTKRLPAQLPLGTTPAVQNDNSEPQTTYGDRLYAADDHTAISVNIKEGESLAAVLLPNANLAPDSSLSIEFSPSAEEFALTVESDYMALDDVVISQLRIVGGGAGRNIRLDAECDELLAMGSVIPDVSLSASAAADNSIDLALYFSNTDTALSGHLAAEATLSRTEDNALRVVADITDSYLVSPLQRWNISAPKIDYSPKGLFVDNFRATTESGGLFVDGEVSRSTQNPLLITLQNVTLGEWVGIVGGIEGVDGVVDGKMELYSALNRPYGMGALALSSLSVGGVDVDPMEVSVELSSRSEEVHFELGNTLYDKNLAKGTFNYSTGRYAADVDVDELELSLLGPLVGAFAEDIEGVGAIDLAIAGTGNALDINGSVEVANFGAKVGFTGATYKAPNLSVKFRDNRGEISPIRIEDGEGGWAEAEGYIDLRNLSDVGFGISLVPHNLVAIDLAADSGSPFYGKVYASGGVRLSSKGGTTEISGAINTGAGSVFNLPLTGNNDFAGADFVTFVNPSSKEDIGGSALVTRKKSELLERKRQRVEGNTIIDVMLGVDTNTLLRLIIDPETENTIEARGVADLGLSLDARKDEFAIRGDYEISEGVYNFNFQNIITKQFTINPNSYIRWNGSPLDANIDVGATYKLKTSLAPLLGSESTASRASTPVECIVNLTGSLANVAVSFDINVPNANTEYQSILSSYFSSQEMMATQFVYLLTMGNFYSDSSAGQTNTASAAGTAIGFEFLTAQVSRLVSNDAYKFDLKYRAIDDTSSSYSIDFQTEIIDDRLLLELEANVDTGEYYQLGEGSNQLSGGGAVTLLLDDTGDFYLKGFSRTIDRFDENQGLQENGVGLYFKRSFNRPSDLWRKKKSEGRADSEKSDNFVTTQQDNESQNENNKKE